MGCPRKHSDCDDDEKPTHQVTLSDFYMGKYEVTQKQWAEIMGSNPSYFKNCDNCPVETVSWNDVQEFIKKLNQLTGKNYRLPTEAEWEYAARGGALASSTPSPKYAGSNNIDDVAWYNNKLGKTHPVGEKIRTILGLYDLSGNVMEWCNDWYGDYSRKSQIDPTGPPSGLYRVVRGGSWYSSANSCEVCNRNYNSVAKFSDAIGFRLLLH
ncbi:MAG: formylglycine-generating enzyme family protein [Bacteroidales bacterium]|nr:formylglycine-generating enzyme family protein [Bacteroidales bacterium]